MTQAQNLRLELLAALLDSSWVIEYSTRNGQHLARLYSVDVRVNTSIVTTPCGRGTTVEEATRDYLRQLSGKTIVVGPWGEAREIPLPADMVLAVFGD